MNNHLTPRPTEAWICNRKRTLDLSKRMNNRIYASNNLHMNLEPRAVQTKRVQFPILDARKKPMVDLENRGIFCSKTTFSPGDSAPFNGYMKKVDDESKLLNIVFPIQNGLQSKFIPGMTSDLFINSNLVVGRNEVNPHVGLFEKNKYNTQGPCFGNQIGQDLFHNNTKVQLKNVKY